MATISRLGLRGQSVQLHDEVLRGDEVDLMCLSHTRAESREAVKLASSSSQIGRLMDKLTKAFVRGGSWTAGRILGRAAHF